MKREKAIKIFNMLKAGCPSLMLAGSVLREKEDGINNLGLIFIGKVFPMHLFPVGDMESLPKVTGFDILEFKYQGEQIHIHRTDKDKIGAMLLHLTGPKEYSIYTRSIAKRKGLKLNKHGLFQGSKCLASRTEKEILEKLGLKVISPVERNKFRSIRM